MTDSRSSDGSDERQRVQTLIGASRFEEAVAVLEAICRAPSAAARDWFVLGQLRLQLNQPEASLEALERADTLAPGQARIVNPIAHALFSLGRQPDAYARLERQRTLTPDDTETHVNLGYVAEQLERKDDAFSHYSDALAIEPGDYRARQNRGALSVARGDYDDALADYDVLVEAHPDSATAWFDQAECLKKASRFEAAVASADRVLAIDARHVNATMCKAVALASVGKVDEAQTHFDEAFRIDTETAGRYGEVDSPVTAPPDARAIHIYQAFQCLYQAAWRGYDDFVSALKRYIASPIGPPNDLSMAFPAMYAPLTADESGTIHAAISNEVVRLAGAPLAPVAPVQKSRLRLGYLSSKFHPHPSFVLTRGLYAAHDRDRFEIFAYALDPHDGSPERIEAAHLPDAFVELSELSDAEAAARIRADGIDILVDLNGFSDDARPGISARRPASIQVTYLGHQHSLYAPWIDYRLTDPIAEPDSPDYAPPEARAFLPPSFYVYDERRRPRMKVPERDALNLPQDALVFCGFNGPAKFEPTVFDAWMRILKRVDQTVLWLLDPGEAAAANLGQASQQAGVSSTRLIFAPRIPHAEHIERQQAADLFLDTFSHGAHTNALDGLHANVPFVTRKGETVASRIGASFLTALDMTELITHSSDVYVELICELANDSERLSRLKAHHYSTIKGLNPFSSAPVAAKLEAAYEQMWERFVAGERPADFDVNI